MKKLFALLLTSLFISTHGYAQEEQQNNLLGHELGVDLSPMLQRALGSGNSSSTTPYALMYRYHFEDWAIRAGVGGFYSNLDGVVNDTLTEENLNYNLSFRLGVERKWNFAQRWQFFYGIDFRAMTRESRRTTVSAQNSTDFFLDNNESYGVAPLLGFRFKINDRLSLVTQSNFSIFYSTRDTEREMQSGTYNYDNQAEGWETNFSPPTSIFLTLNF